MPNAEHNDNDDDDDENDRAHFLRNHHPRIFFVIKILIVVKNFD